MNTKVARIQDLVGSGWEIEDIVSDDANIAVLLQRGQARSTVVLGRQDAWDVLFGDAFAPDRPAHERHEVVISR